MILTAHQPVYLPWLGLFHKIGLADIFCIFDIVQYQKKDFNNRNKIKTHNGPIWLTVPVESKNHFKTKICDIRIINNGWNKKHFKSIELAYKKALFFEKYIDDVKTIFNTEYKFLTDLNTDILKFFLKCLKIDIPIVKASDYDFKGKKSDLVLDMCVKLGASKYIFGEQGKNYADAHTFNNSGIEIFFQEYNHPQYKQLHGEFQPFMSVIDLLFNEGEKSKEIIFYNNCASI
ncbi:MAG: WbqC family protein [Deltaproteobacteria bacterium]|nr:WbqC family protein [Deltaproteobacteria bacterium]